MIEPAGPTADKRLDGSLPRIVRKTVLSRILIAAVLILVTMVVLKDGRVLRDAQLTGTCSFYQTATDGTEWETCKPGRLEGRPDLSSKGCRSGGLRGKVEFWHCPASVVASQATR